MKTCVEPGCDEDVKALGLCHKHHMRVLRKQPKKRKQWEPHSKAARDAQPGLVRGIPHGWGSIT